MFKGSFTALITPFKGGQVDDKAFQQLVAKRPVVEPMIEMIDGHDGEGMRGGGMYRLGPVHFPIVDRAAAVCRGACLSRR